MALFNKDFIIFSRDEFKTITYQNNEFKISAEKEEKDLTDDYRSESYCLGPDGWDLTEKGFSYVKDQNYQEFK